MSSVSVSFIFIPVKKLLISKDIKTLVPLLEYVDPTTKYKKNLNK